MRISSIWAVTLPISLEAITEVGVEAEPEALLIITIAVDIMQDSSQAERVMAAALVDTDTDTTVAVVAAAVLVDATVVVVEVEAEEVVVDVSQEVR